MVINVESEFWSTQELSRYLGVSKKFIEKHRVGGRIPGAVQIGNRWRFRRSEVEKRLLSGKLLLPVDNRK